MMKTKYFKKLSMALFSLTIVLLFTVGSCKKDNVDELISANETGSLKIEFDHLAGGSSLVLGNNYVNAAGETMNFSMFNYYVSNFSLVKSDGSVYTIPKDECYFLIKEEGGENTEIELKNIPAGEYKEIRFLLGVDSLKSIAPASERTGVLDPAGDGAGMYWMWNSGYIFVKVEGTSPQAPLDSASNSNKFRYHIGLFGGYSSPTLNNLRTITLNSSDVAQVSKDITPSCHVTVNILQMFTSPTNISVAAQPTIMVDSASAIIANNYQDMFFLHHIHN